MTNNIYGLVKTKEGMYRVDNPQHVPDEVWAKFTQEQKDFANNNRIAGSERTD